MPGQPRKRNAKQSKATQNKAKQRKTKRTKMKTLKEIIIDRKTRKGPATKITKDGAYWETSVCILRDGGDGIGQSSAQIHIYLEIRHYRNEEVRGYINRNFFHQNDGETDNRTRADDVLEATNIEDLIRIIKGHKISSDYGDAWNVETSSQGEDRLRKEIPEMPASEPAPDEI
jgi:hypothetical protein